MKTWGVIAPRLHRIMLAWGMGLMFGAALVALCVTGQTDDTLFVWAEGATVVTISGIFYVVTRKHWITDEH